MTKTTIDFDESGTQTEVLLRILEVLKAILAKP